MMGTDTIAVQQAKKTIRYIRENDCDFLTVATLQAYGHADADACREALRDEMGPEWRRQVWAGTATLTAELAADTGMDWIDGQQTVLLEDEPRPPFGSELGRLFAIDRGGRRWTRVLEYLSNGQLTARWFVDESTGEARMADGARKPKRWPMDRAAAEYVKAILDAADRGA